MRPRIACRFVEGGQRHALEAKPSEVAVKRRAVARILERMGEKEVLQTVVVDVGDCDGVAYREQPFRDMADARVHALEHVARPPDDARSRRVDLDQPEINVEDAFARDQGDYARKLYLRPR